MTQLQQLIALAREHNFVIASDECYSEIYFDEDSPPPGLLAGLRRDGRQRLPQLRGVPQPVQALQPARPALGLCRRRSPILRHFLLYRTYHGCAMPPHHQLGSIAAWNDEAHVQANRELYRDKVRCSTGAVDGTLDVARPDAGFYLWPRRRYSDTEFARSCTPASTSRCCRAAFSARESSGINPGDNRVRMALVAEPDQCIEAARRIVRCLAGCKAPC